jgi:hypothetical protein
MLEKLNEWYSEVKKEEVRMIILPWKKDSKANPIREAKDIPTRVSELQWYFPRAQPPSKATRNIMYTQAHIATDQDPSLLITKKKDSAMDWWYEENGGGVYMKPLPDADRPQTIGFMAYSGNFTDPIATQGLINKALKDQNCSKPVGVRLKPHPGTRNVRDLKDKHKSEGGSWFTEPFITLQIEADAKDAREVKNGLYKAFNQKGSQPYGLNFRFVPNKAICLLSADGIEKLQKMWLKHQTDVKALKASTSEDILHLDRPYKTHGTLREFISSMQHSTNKSKLFHSVDKSQSWMDETGMTTIMMSFAENQDEADSVAQLLPAIVEHDISTECALEWFTEEAYNRVCEIEYDKESNTFVSPDDKMMDYLLLDERKIELEGMPQPEKEQPAQEQKLGSDQSFVSFGTTLGKKTPNPQTPGNDSTSSPTDISKMLEIEQLNATQQALIAKLQAEVDQLKIDQQPSDNTGKPTTTANDSGSNRPPSEEQAADSDADSGATG